ncbi:MAG: hypothetical protein WCB94_13550 [Terriglobales bacterium]
MNLRELENTLPNGLHDAEVRGIHVDYEQHRLTLDLAVWVGSMDDPPKHREAYKSGQLDISGLIFLVMESPDAKYPYRVSSQLTIDSVEEEKSVPSELLRSLPADAFCHSFWVSEWNTCMYFAGTNAEMTWKNNGAVTYR